MTTTTPGLLTMSGRPSTAQLTLVALGNEIDKGLRFGWAERKQIVLELIMFVPLFLLYAAVARQGEAVLAGRFEWSFDDRRTAWLLIGFAFGMFFFLQVQKFFWRQLAEIQGGTLEQVYLSPLPWWALAAVGRVLASILETLFVVGALYAAVDLIVGVDIDWRPVGLVPAGFLLIGAIGHSLIIGGLTILWKRTEILNDMLLLVLFFLGGIFISLDEMPGWMAALGRLLPVTHPIESGRHVLLDGGGLTVSGDGGLLWMAGLAAAWLATGIAVFHHATQIARRDGTLTRY
ncbi:MAG: ABC transporter permease [Acidimicrobiales bacterium]